MCDKVLLSPSPPSAHASSQACRGGKQNRPKTLVACKKQGDVPGAHEQKVLGAHRQSNVAMNHLRPYRLRGALLDAHQHRNYVWVPNQVWFNAVRSSPFRSVSQRPVDRAFVRFPAGPVFRTCTRSPFAHAHVRHVVEGPCDVVKGITCGKKLEASPRHA